MASGESEVDIESVRDSSESEDVEDLRLESYHGRQPNRTISSTNEPDAHRGCAAGSQSKPADRMEDTADRVFRSSRSSLTEAMSPLHSDPEGPGNSHQSTEDLSISTSPQLLPPELPRTGAASPLTPNQEAPDSGSAFPPLDGSVRCRQEQAGSASTDHVMLAPRPLSAPTSSAASRRGSAEKELPTRVTPKTNLGFVLNGASPTAPRDGTGTASEPLDGFGATVGPATAWPPRNPSVNSGIHSPDRTLHSVDPIDSDRQDQVGRIEVARLSSNAGLIQPEMGATDYWQERVATDARNWADVSNATERRKIQNRQSQWRRRMY